MVRFLMFYRVSLTNVFLLTIMVVKFSIYLNRHVFVIHTYYMA